MSIINKIRGSIYKLKYMYHSYALLVMAGENSVSEQSDSDFRDSKEFQEHANAVRILIPKLYACGAIDKETFDSFNEIVGI